MSPYTVAGLNQKETQKFLLIGATVDHLAAYRQTK